MFADQLRHAITRAPRSDYHRVSSALWKALSAGHVTEAEASGLSDLLEARRALPAPGKPVQRRVGSRPRSPASMERRRSWAASGHLPPRLAAHFTMGEAAVLAVIAIEVRRQGRCTLTIPHLASLAGVGRSTAKRALSAAHALGAIRIVERRLSAFRNDSNIVTVIDPAWSAWLRLRRAEVGSNFRPAAQYKKKEGLGAPAARRAFEEGGRNKEARRQAMERPDRTLSTRRSSATRQ
jgi:hypothetical protein